MASRKLRTYPKKKLADRFECLSKVPIIDTIKLINAYTAKELVSYIEKNCRFSPCESILGELYCPWGHFRSPVGHRLSSHQRSYWFRVYFGKGGDFSVMAAAFHHLKSNEDRDLAGSTPPSWTPSHRGPYSYQRSRFRPLSGTCCYFQKHGRCSIVSSLLYALGVEKNHMAKKYV